MTGKRIAIYGLGRSGLSVARAALQLGAAPVVFDRSLPEQMSKQDVLQAVRELGVELRLGWGEFFDVADFDWVVTNPAVDMRSVVLQRAVADGIEVLSEVEFAYRVLVARFSPPPSEWFVSEGGGQGEGDSGALQAGRISTPHPFGSAQGITPSSKKNHFEEGGFPALVAITGTNGKSTTTVMTYLALCECGIDAVLCGNIFGTGLPEVPLTEAALHATADQVLVAEISSFQLEWVSQFRPAVAGITNIWPDHLDRYESFQQYADTKHRIFATQTDADFAVVKEFDPHVEAPGGSSAKYRRRPPGSQSQKADGLEGHPTVLTFGAQGEQAQVLEEEIRILDKSIRTDEMQVIGTHNYSNAAMAGLMAYATLKWLANRGGDILVPDSGKPKQERVERSSTGDRNVPATGGAVAAHARTLLAEAESALIEKGGAKRRLHSKFQTPNSKFEALPQPIIDALKSFKGIEHRMEVVGSKNGVRVINNSMCTNPDAVVKSAQSVKGPNHLIMGGKDKDLPFAPVRNYLASGMHKAYLFGESKDLLNQQLGGGFPTYNTLQEAFRAATEKARPGEVIMLAPGCASTDQFNDFRDRGNVFKAIAKEWLNS